MVADTISTAINGMIAFMMAKFILNDVPHTLGLTPGDSPVWVPHAWNKLNTYALTHGIRFFSPQEGYISTLERRMPVNDITGGPLLENVRSFMLIYEKLIAGPLPNVKLPTRNTIEKIRTFMAGYHLIAVGEASNEVVNDVYSLIKYPFLQFYEAYEEGPEQVTEFEEMGGTIRWYEDLKTAASLFVDGSRADKVIAIDAVAHLLHEYEPRSIIEDLFKGYLVDITFTPLGVALAQMYDIWFGIDPRKGTTFADYVEYEWL